MLFLICALGILYVLVGYPVWLAGLARLRGTTLPGHADWQPTISVLLPVHNGGRWLRQKLDTLYALNYPAEKLQVIVIADGCTDGTAATAQEYPVRLIQIPQGGKAAALNEGLKHAAGEVLFYTDVRQPLHPDALQHLIRRLADPAIGVVTGELIIRDGNTREEANIGMYWKYEKWIRRNLSSVDSVLGATGCIYAMRRELARPLPVGTLLDDVHQPLNAFFAGYRIAMEGKAQAYDEPTGLETEFWRKVRTQAGIYQLIRQFPGLLWPTNRMWLHFVSYKFGRLLLPFLLLGMFLGTWQLPAPWREILLTGQFVFYGLALLNRWVPKGAGPIKAVSSLASAFVVLTGAALCATAIWVVPPERLWRKR